MENYKIDQSIKSAKYRNGKPEDGLSITIENLEQMPMPVEVEVKEKGKDAQSIKLPVEIWMRGKEWTFAYPSTSEVEHVKLNPKGILPDSNTKNNTWKPESK